MTRRDPRKNLKAFDRIVEIPWYGPLYLRCYFHQTKKGGLIFVYAERK